MKIWTQTNEEKNVDQPAICSENIAELLKHSAGEAWRDDYEGKKSSERTTPRNTFSINQTY